MSLVWPWYLLGLSALALPWLLHRFSRQDPPVEKFPSTRFLDATPPPVSRRKSLRYRGLFLLRLLFLLALCLLFAEPLLRSPLAALATPGRVVVVAVDTSFSMRFADRWTQARDAYNRVVDTLDAQTAVHVLAFGNTLSSVGDVVRGGGAATALFGQLAPGYGGQDFDRLMRRLDRLAGESRLPVDAIVITDAQQSRMPRQLNALLARQLRSLQIIDVSSETDSNAWLFASARSANGATADVAVTAGYAANPGGESRVDRVVEVSTGERLLARQAVSLSNGEVDTIHFENLPLPAIEGLDLTVQFDTLDAQPLDDRQSVPVRDSTPIGFTLASIGTRPDPAARVYLQTALETGQRAQVRSLPAGSAQLPADTLHAVVLTSLTDTASLPQALVSLLESGSNILAINVPNSLADPGRAASRGRAIIGVDASHPLDLGGIDWTRVRAWNLPEFSAHSRDRVLVQTVDGTPLLIEHIRDGEPGGGRLLILNDPLDGDASDLPLQPAFVELLARIVDWFSAHSAYPDRLASGELLSLTAGTQILDPDGTALLSLTETGQARELTLSEPGVYTIVGAQGDYRLPVVVAARESDIRRLPDAEQRAWEARHNRDGTPADRPTAEDDTSRELSMPGLTGQPLWRYLLPVLIVVLLAESLLGNRRLAVRRDGT